MVITDVNFNAEVVQKFALTLIPEQADQLATWLVGNDLLMVRKGVDTIWFSYKNDFDDSYHTVEMIKVVTTLGSEEVSLEKSYLVKKTTLIEVKNNLVKDVFASLV